MSAPAVLVAGCGYVGLALARRLHAAGWRVTGCTHSPDSAAALASEPFPVLACDITDGEAIAASFAGTAPWRAVVHCASSGRGGADQYRRVYLGGTGALLYALRPEQFIFTGSTSVYAQIEGEFVTETSPAEPVRETGLILREAEELAVASGGTVARLAGIYGPARSALLRKFLAGESVIEGDGQRWINQIHRDDAAAALHHLIDRQAPGIFNVADDEPLTQRALLTNLAAHFDMPLPPAGPIDTNRKRGWTHKRVLNGKLRLLGWEPMYPSFLHALREHGSALAAPG